jgi:hypothetical protein
LIEEREKHVKKRNSGYTNKHEKLINGPTTERSKKNVKSKRQESRGIAPLNKGPNLCLLIVFLGPFDQ